MGNQFRGRQTDVMKLAIAALLSVSTALSAAYPYPQSNEFAQERDGAPSYGKQPDGYFQYVNVPAHKEYEFGWNRGNPHHYISRYEQGKDHRFRTRVRWGDKHDHKVEYHPPPKYHAAAA